MRLILALEQPTKPMHQEALAAGRYHSEGWNRDYQKVQIVTIADPLDGKRPDVPRNQMAFSEAERIARSTHQLPAMTALFEQE